jgi:tetratricopeptide (TPR) repeat protein
MARRSKQQGTPPPKAMPAAPAPRSVAWWHIALLLTVSLAVYANALGNGFVSDDDFQVLSNKLITDWHNIPKMFTTNVWAFAEETTTNYYRPLHMVIYLVEYYLFGYNALFWHLANLGFHLAALVAAYFLVRALAGETLALWAGLWFALHPIHVEAVVWVAVLTDLLCGLALFLGVHFHHRARCGSWPALFLTLAALAFFCGLLMKETAMVFPTLVAAYEFFYRRESLTALLRGAWRYLPYLAALALYVPMRFHALGRFAPSSGMHFQLTPFEMFLSVPVLFAQYVGKLLLPINLNYYYVYEPVRAFGWQPAAAMLLLAGVAAAAFWLRKTQPLVAFALAWFILTLAPVLSIPNVGENVFTERYLYIPSLGFCVVGAWAWLELRKRFPQRTAQRILAAALGLLFVFYTVQTVRRNPDWRDDIRLFTKTAEQSPRSATILMNLGYIYYLHGDVDRSIEFYRRSLEIDANRALTHNNLGNSLSSKGRYPEAISHLRRAIELKQNYFGAWLNLGLVYANLKDWDQAIECYRRAVALRPDLSEAWTAMGLALWNKGDAQGAIAAYRKAVEAQPDYVEALINLASALSETGAPDEAIEHLYAALRANPGGPHASVIHYNLGVNFEKKQVYRSALIEYERALAANPNFIQARQKVEFWRAKFPTEQPALPFRSLPSR